MNRSDRTQAYLDLAKISLEVEKNINEAVKLSQLAIDCINPVSLAQIQSMTKKLKDIRYELYDLEADKLVELCRRESNAVEIGSLTVSADGKVTADV